MPDGTKILTVDCRDSETWHVAESPHEVAMMIAGVPHDELCRRVAAADRTAREAANIAASLGDHADPVGDWARSEHALVLAMSDLLIELGPDPATLAPIVLRHLCELGKRPSADATEAPK